jgi:D-alanyl-D-alanine-carboxypeptidase/D-alanyl-D-alanine-endopeptidase
MLITILFRSGPSEYPKAPSLHFASNKSLSASYVALGWFIDTNLGTEVIQHSGGIDGYSSFVGWNTHLK